MTIEMEAIISNSELQCNSEYGRLEKVLVCPPTFMSISEIINETQKHYAEDNIDESLATKQHRNFVAKMKEAGIEVINLEALERFPEQVFTRDIGFTLGDILFVSNMGSEVRHGEEQLFKNWLDEQGATYLPLTDNSIEGGDVIVDRDVIFVGISGRTSSEGIHKLAEATPGFTVQEIPIDKSYLHLDCVFNVLSPTEALVFPPALRKEELDYLATRYELIEVTKEEQFTMGTNVLSVGDKKVFSLPCNEKVNKDMRDRGYDVIEVDISEIIKSGGSFRCCTLPVKRSDI
ncbi:dimethylarginine dimethylaminohydrolase family protein [Bacillus haimaensis]|uniref:dimethylarginine dimethylaminohydrolase family protein n=1 Tax=Bacillus haimaensis TaxID=3160967 RepID=UPI003AA90BC7